jgi:hypothetical protein
MFDGEVDQTQWRVRTSSSRGLQIFSMVANFSFTRLNSVFVAISSIFAACSLSFNALFSPWSSSSLASWLQHCGPPFLEAMLDSSATDAGRVLLGATSSPASIAAYMRSIIGKSSFFPIFCNIFFILGFSLSHTCSRSASMMRLMWRFLKNPVTATASQNAGLMCCKLCQAPLQLTLASREAAISNIVSG